MPMYTHAFLIYKVDYKSPNMERLALKKCLSSLLPIVRIEEIATDASTSIIAILAYNVSWCMYAQILFCMTTTYTARDYPNIFHSLDVWHKAKKLRKALEEVHMGHVHVCTCTLT